jgi:hypothetical protein
LDPQNSDPPAVVSFRGNNTWFSSASTSWLDKPSSCPDNIWSEVKIGSLCPAASTRPYARGYSYQQYWILVNSMMELLEPLHSD